VAKEAHDHEPDAAFSRSHNLKMNFLADPRVTTDDSPMCSAESRIVTRQALALPRSRFSSNQRCLPFAGLRERLCDSTRGRSRAEPEGACAGRITSPSGAHDWGDNEGRKALSK
jgi:hypothetical protein